MNEKHIWWSIQSPFRPLIDYDCRFPIPIASFSHRLGIWDYMRGLRYTIETITHSTA